MKPLLAGDIVVDLHCVILHRSQPLGMCIKATAQVSPYCIVRYFKGQSFVSGSRTNTGCTVT